MADADPGLTAAIEQLGMGATDWAAQLIRYRAALLDGGFTTDVAEELTVQFDARVAFLGAGVEPESSDAE